MTTWQRAISTLGFAGLGFLLSCSVAADTPGIQILYLNDYQEDQQLVVDASAKFHFPPKVLSAIHHEIPLTFTTEIELNEIRTLLGIPFSRNRTQIVYRTELQYIGYNRTYVIANKRNQKVQSFDSLKEAMKTLGTLSNFRIADLADLHPDTLYAVKMRISLDQWQLPTPLIIDTLWSSDWQLDSDWRSIEIQSPKSWL